MMRYEKAYLHIQTWGDNAVQIELQPSGMILFDTGGMVYLYPVSPIHNPDSQSILERNNIRN